jgi:hypothetical protein
LEKEGGAGEAKHEEDSESLGRQQRTQKKEGWRGRHRKRGRRQQLSSDGDCGGRN